MRKKWSAGALASTMILGGCAHTAATDEAALGRLPIGQKQEVFTAQHNVSVAEANLQAAEQARGQGSAFRSVARDELSAARSRMSAANEALELGRKTGSSATISAAQENADFSQKQLVAARAKVNYADRLLALRDKEHKLAKDRLEEAQVEQQLAAARTLQRSGVTVAQNVADLGAKHDRLHGEIDGIERQVATLRDEVNAQKIAWDSARQSYDVATRENPVPAPMRPPPPPSRVTPAPSPGAPPPPNPGNPNM